MLKSRFSPDKIEAGCDEAGRGCLAGPVVAAAVILPPDYKNPDLDDSKKILSKKKREELRGRIVRDALDFAVAEVSNNEIDEINILNASYLAMHRALDMLQVRPELLLIDGNRFNPYKNLPYECIIKGDGKFLSIAAASILAKTHRDELMIRHSKYYRNYGWETNVGYPTSEHRDAIRENGVTPLHRRSFQLIPTQLKLFRD